jgi:hypothetical protein
MATLAISRDVLDLIKYAEGETIEDKLIGLVSADLARRLRECEREIGDFELKYRMTFAEFAKAWESDEIPNKWSHQVERDYMIWGGLEAEKRKWLSLLKGKEQHAR